ncbi:MAG: AAA family ATPase [Helicobacteraceae bacterium]|nr:AAA family ATPase [Helicobacteraceae bacterium]
MISEITLENFLSFNEKQTIQLTDEHNNPLKVFTLIGNNSSGKTNILKAIAYVKNIAVNSFKFKPEEIFLLKNNKFNSNKISTIEIKFLINNKKYTYKIQIDYILKYECLHIDNELIFEITSEVNDERSFIDSIVNNKGEKFGVKAKIYRNKKYIKIINKYKEFLKPNASLISTVKNLNGDYFNEIYNYFNTLIIYDNTTSQHNNLFRNSDFMDFISSQRYKEKVLNILQVVDSDISEIIPITKKVENKSYFVSLDDESKPVTNNKTSEIQEIIFKKDGVEFTFQEQSHGVLKLMQIIHNLLPILENGGVLVVDEIENGLHPKIYKKLLAMFNNNENSCQLIFTTHNLLFLDQMQKDEICIVNKIDHSSQIQSLKHFYKAKSSYHNFLREYMNGTYDIASTEPKEPDTSWLND